MYTVHANQYLPNGFGKPAATYYYIKNTVGEIYHHDGKFRKKCLIDMVKYKFTTRALAEIKVEELNSAPSKLPKRYRRKVTLAQAVEATKLIDDWDNYEAWEVDKALETLSLYDNQLGELTAEEVAVLVAVTNEKAVAFGARWGLAMGQVYISRKSRVVTIQGFHCALKPFDFVVDVGDGYTIPCKKVSTWTRLDINVTLLLTCYQ